MSKENGADMYLSKIVLSKQICSRSKVLLMYLLIEEQRTNRNYNQGFVHLADCFSWTKGLLQDCLDELIEFEAIQIKPIPFVIMIKRLL